ncbi:hypothetical protein [Subtercola vilae]|uniref:DUF559 domain-containing protein n=1 Tax=Subtercola vilae TaxID=2056433 RepID=A0A4T2B547_9MICO|nr:hypothetical protein [Subtercola vilae]TIH26013.1 hypothetical protein D4765_19100 [Subtercola vilae]
MPKLTPLPPSLAGRSFSVARAAQSGVGPERLRSSDLRQPYRGVRTPLQTFTTVEQQCAAYSERLLPGQFFSHLTAARLWNLPLPTRFHTDEAIHVATVRPGQRVRCRGVVAHQLDGRLHAAGRVGAFRVSDPESTWCQLAGILSIDALIVAGDALVHVPRYFDETAPAPRPYSTLSLLTQKVDRFRGPGKTRLREALGLVRVGAASPTETALRLLIVRSGLPEPTLDAEIRDRTGRFIAWGDLYYPRERVMVEYDGDHHRTSTSTYEKDQIRAENIRDTGIRQIRVRMRGLSVDAASTVARLRVALASRPLPPVR